MSTVSHYHWKLGNIHLNNLPTGQYGSKHSNHGRNSAQADYNDLKNKGKI